MTAREIVFTALRLDPAKRIDYVSQECDGDPKLMDEALDLLRVSSGGADSVAGSDATTTFSYAFSEQTASAVIGPYRLVRQLGEGGMGVVYQAHQIEPIRREVALKLIKPGMDSKQVIARFESERQALALMDHSNIARVFDAGTTSTGQPYFVMELVDGVPLTRYCDSKRLTLKERIELFIPVCQAIQHAHQKGVIHRDIKPSNVLVTEQEGKRFPKVIDFGLAKALGHQLSNATMMTNLDTVMGTFQYMSPEQAEPGKHDIDTRSDVYSLGAVLYELLAGTTPLEHESMAEASYVEILQRIREEEPPTPSERVRRSARLAETAAQRGSDPARLPKLVQGDLDWVTMKALEKDRTRRYETVNGLVRDLERYLASEPVEAAPASSAYRLGKFARKHRAWLSTAAAFTVLLITGVTVSSWMAIRASRAEQEARAVNNFLEGDLLGQASAKNQSKAGAKADPDLKVRTALDLAADRIGGKFAAQPLVEASIRETIGKAFRDLGLYPKAEKQLERAIDLRHRLLGERHPDTLTSMDTLVTVFLSESRYADAEGLASKVLEFRRKALGAKHRDTLVSMGRLAAVYFYKANYAQAEQLEVEALNLGRQVWGEESQETLELMADLTTTYIREAKFDRAEPLIRNTLEVRRRVSGEEHPDTLNTMNNLAALYFNQQKYGEAESLFTKSFEIRSRVLGEEHPDTLQSMSNVALVYRSQGKLTEAERLYEQALKLQRRILGVGNISTLITMNNLAGLYRVEGKYSEAEALLQEALEGEARTLPKEHDLTLTSMSSLAQTYFEQDKHSQAAELYGKVLDAERHKLGEANPATLSTVTALGHVRLLQRKYVEAESLLRSALKSPEQSSGDTGEQFQTQGWLGESLAGQGKYLEAEPLLLSSYEGILQRGAESASDRTNLKVLGERIVDLYKRWGAPEKAAAWTQKIMVLDR